MSVRELFQPNGYNLNCHNLNVDGLLELNTLQITGTNNATDTLTGSLIVNGGVSMKGNCVIGDNIISPNFETYDDAIELKQDLHLVNGSHTSILSVNSVGNLSIINSNNLYLTPPVHCSSGIDSSSQITGALIVTGGVGVNKDIWMGGTLHNTQTIYCGVLDCGLIDCSTTTTSLEVDTGSIVLASGTPLNHYSEDSFSYALGGALASVNVTGSFVKLNNQVTMNFNTILGASNAAATIYTGTSSIPTLYRPLNDSWTPVVVQNNTAIVLGTVNIRASGAIVWYVDGDKNFSASGSCGIYNSTVVFKQ